MAYVFFRQGESFIVDVANPKNEIRLQTLTDRNLEGANLFNNETLVITTSQEIDFYHIENVPFNEFEPKS